jgi:hypothetical protein
MKLMVEVGALLLMLGGWLLAFHALGEALRP